MADPEVGGERDRWLAAAMTAAGGAVIGLALFRRWDPHEMSPGAEGALTAAILGPMLALLHGLRFSRVLLLAVPIWILQLLACAAVSSPAVAPLGLELVALGGFGVVLSLDPWDALASRLRRRPRAAPRREREGGLRVQAKRRRAEGLLFDSDSPPVAALRLPCALALNSGPSPPFTAIPAVSGHGIALHERSSAAAWGTLPPEVVPLKGVTLSPATFFSTSRRGRTRANGTGWCGR